MKRTNTGGNPSYGGGNGGQKKTKFNEDYDEFGGAGEFEDDFNLLDESIYEKIEGADDADGTELHVGKWIRPREAEWNSSERALAFQWLDIDMVSGQPLQSNPAGGPIVGSTEGPVPVVRMYGVTQEGYSVMASIHGFTPYFYASLNGLTDLSDGSLGKIRNILDQKVLNCLIYIFLYLFTIIFCYLDERKSKR